MTGLSAEAKAGLRPARHHHGLQTIPAPLRTCSLLHFNRETFVCNSGSLSAVLASRGVQADRYPACRPPLPTSPSICSIRAKVEWPLDG